MYLSLVETSRLAGFMHTLCSLGRTPFLSHPHTSIHYFELIFKFNKIIYKAVGGMFSADASYTLFGVWSCKVLSWEMLSIPCIWLTFQYLVYHRVRDLVLVLFSFKLDIFNKEKKNTQKCFYNFENVWLGVILIHISWCSLFGSLSF